MCVRAAAKIGLDVAGIDIVCRDIAPAAGRPGRRRDRESTRRPASACTSTRAAASRATPATPSSTACWATATAASRSSPCTGTNGKTTTTLLIATRCAWPAASPACTTTHGVYIDGKQVVKGDCTGYWSARTVLAAPDVEFAVLETARGGILKRGLAFDRCDVGIVLNVAPDHLGLDGVDTIEDLAQVKAVVPLSPRARRC
jgi:cyanophycin synthetase